MKKIHLLVSFLVLGFYVHAQNIWTVKPFEVGKCEKCLSIVKNIPIEVSFGLIRKGNDLFLVCNDKVWYEKLFKTIDGISVEILSKDQFVCNGDNISLSNPICRGLMMEPMYERDLKKNIVSDDKGVMVIHVGLIPAEYINKEIEYNLLYINSKTLCYSLSHYNIDSYLWELLDMGMYLDTINYKSKGIKTSKSFTMSSKTMTFTIPFEKGKFDYSPTDIKSLYDSLNLTNFDIVKMSIRAYSSVEGSEEKNNELQEKRVKSIVSALQSYQKPSIQTDITTAENWVEFMNDIPKTSYANLVALNKAEIKEKLNDKQTLETLESILRNHRKAIISIDLEKKNEVQLMTDEQLISSFKKSIEEKNIAMAITIQKQAFQRISTQKSPNSLMQNIEIPQKKDFSELLNNKTAFDFMYNNLDAYQTLLDFEKLDALMPKNAHIKYNICALKFKTILLGKGMLDPVKFQKEINDLKLYGIDSKLIKRMLINYNIIMCEYYMQLNDYVNKDKCLNYLTTNYKNIPYNPQDVINLAQYLVAYAKYDIAIKTLAPFVKSVDCDENVLFYYINLVIVKDEVTKKNDFRNILLNAYNVNPTRFCKLFNSYESGGVTFQLLQNDYLKRSYCESCKKNK